MVPVATGAIPASWFDSSPGHEGIAQRESTAAYRSAASALAAREWLRRWQFDSASPHGIRHDGSQPYGRATGHVTWLSVILTP